MAKIEGKVARRYARALFELCQPEQMETRREALHTLSAAWTENRELRLALSNPGITISDREAIVRDLAAKALAGDAALANFLALLLTNGRISVLPQAATIFSDMVDASKRRLALEVVSAFDLSGQERASFEEKVRAQSGGMASITWRTDASLIGGLIIRAGDLELDGSVNGALEKIRTELAAS